MERMTDRRKKLLAGTAELQLQRMQGEACRELRELWEEVFFEDSEKFTDYYFEEKAGRNRGYALRDGEGTTVAMLYLSPYPVMLRRGDGFACREIHYIVGVATRREYRHRGCMDRLLGAALHDMYDEASPFTFLMPADPAIYRPYQFAYIYDKEEYSRTGGTGIDPGGRPDGESGYSRLAEFMQGFLEKHYDVFIRRDEAYYRVMEKELRAQEGGIHTTLEDGAVRGCFLYTREEGKEEIQEAVWEGEDAGRNPVSPTGGRTPVIMARIVEAGSMLSLLRAECGETSFCIRISDSILDGNNGVWECVLGEKRARVRRIRLKVASVDGTVDGERTDAGISVDALASWVFGYREAEECFVLKEGAKTQEREEILRRLRNVKRPGRVFLNEIV